MPFHVKSVLSKNTNCNNLYFSVIRIVNLWNPDFNWLRNVSQLRNRTLLKRSFAEIKWLEVLHKLFTAGLFSSSAVASD